MALPELSETEKQKAYADYYHRPSALIPEDVLEKIKNKSHQTKDALLFQNINDLLLPGYLAMETGHCRMPDGSFFVAVRTEFHQATADMLDWWFTWHPEDPLRYRIWYPEAHFDTSIERNQNTNPNEPAYWHTTHFPVEDIGLGKEKISIKFVPPAEFGFDTSRFDEANIETVICGYVGSVSRSLDQHTCMCHLLRRYSGGLEMRSRFWMGNRVKLNAFTGKAIVEKLFNSKVMKKLIMPANTGYAMAMHCAQEYNNLAQILPGLYQDYN